jgi:hypothetical protein
MQFRGSFPAVLAAALLALGASRPAAAEAVSFDNVAAAPGGTIFPGNTWLATQGVNFRSVNSTNALFVGQIITVSTGAPRLMVLGNPNAVSRPNFAAASGVFAANGPNDVIMRFTQPVDSVRLVTDRTPGEAPDLVRLVALVPHGPNQFVITAIDTGVDNATTAPANVLAVTPPNPVSFALFQVTTEAEGFDNLRYTHPPDCPHRGPVVGACYKEPDFKDWVPVGCEVVDCCPGCPGPLDWEIYVDGDPFRRLVLRFEDLSPEVAGKLSVEGNAEWNAEKQLLEINGPGAVTLHGFALGADPRSSSFSPRMTLGRIDAPEVVVGAADEAARELPPGPTHSLRLRVTQKVGETEISNSTLVYGF